ncbi:MAG: protein arginine N-methyltransferase 1 [Gammaproteobacteria bacterium]|jgi:protein arginine N-methyltransferase 1
MVNDDIRTNQYIKALRSVVKADSVVLDVGAGPGFFALMACEFGARHVYAIEPDSTILIAQELAEANGYADRMTFIQAMSTDVTLPEKADIVISDLRGALPLFSQHINTIRDIRERHLASDGILIPKQDKLWGGLVESPTLYQNLFSIKEAGKFNLDMQLLYERVRNIPTNKKIYPDERMLVAPQSWAILDYRSVENLNISGQISWEIECKSTAHGLRVWFECQLMDGINYSTAPDKPKTVYNNMFFPLSDPVNLEQGDKVSVSLRANLIGDDYIWRWEISIYSAKNPAEVKLYFKQSSFNGALLSLSDLRKSSASHKPVVNDAGLVDQKIIEMMIQGLSLDVIAHEIIVQFPDYFPDFKLALAHTGELSLKYSK